LGQANPSTLGPFRLAQTIGLSYGTKKVRINSVSNIVIALFAGTGTFCSMFLGKIINTCISVQMGNFIGGSVLVLFGLYMLISAIKKKKEITRNHIDSEKGYFNKVVNHPEIIDTNHSNVIEFKEAFVLGGLLCLNNIGMGIGASITGMNIYITSIASFIFSVVLLQLGCYMGKIFVTNKLSMYAEIISGIIIVLLGVVELCT